MLGNIEISEKKKRVEDLGHDVRHGYKYINILVNAEHYGRAGANPPSLTVRDHVYTCRLVPCFFPQLNCHHGHVRVPVDIGILLLYIYNYAHLVFNEIT